MTLLEQWEPIIGLEIHVQLNTQSKMFSGEAFHFGNEPNTEIGIVSTGQPGSLPVINQEAVHKAVRFGCAVKANISLVSRFDRKSYSYADTPKGYQITQLDFPIVQGGSIECDMNNQKKHFKINRAHLEEDSGILKHFNHFSGVDYNRAGIPLLEIVSEACIHSPREAVSYAMAIKAVVEYIDISDGNMEEGSFRIDANVSVRPKGESRLRNKIEIKNMNSFSYMETALESEIHRQINFYSLHPDKVIVSGTYRFDPQLKELILMRTKERADDYRYFPEPDLPRLILSQSYVEKVRNSLPELPRARYERYLSELHLPLQPTTLLINEKRLSDYFEESLKTCSNPKSLANWLTVEFPGRLKSSGKKIWNIGIPSDHVVELVNLIEAGTITGKIAKSIADEMIKSPGISPLTFVKENGHYQPLENFGEVEQLVDQTLIENPTSIEDYMAGKKKAFAFLVGQVMKKSSGKAPPSLVNELLSKKLKTIHKT